MGEADMLDVQEKLKEIEEEHEKSNRAVCMCVGFECMIVCKNE